jgi:hypothetical protein
MSYIGEVTNVLSPDGVTVLHASNQTVQQSAEFKKKFIIDARKAFLDFAHMQKRSKIANLKHGRFLIEFW